MNDKTAFSEILLLSHSSAFILSPSENTQLSDDDDDGEYYGDDDDAQPFLCF